LKLHGGEAKQTIGGVPSTAFDPRYLASDSRLAEEVTPCRVADPRRIWVSVMLTHPLHNQPNLRMIGRSAGTPWQFPTPYPGKHVDPQSIMVRLRKLGIKLLGARTPLSRISSPRSPLP
jgi:hypothetical protein